MPKPIKGDSARYKVPYKSNGSLAAWADSARRPVKKKAPPAGSKPENPTDSGAAAGAASSSGYFTMGGGADQVPAQPQIQGPSQEVLDHKFETQMNKALSDSDRSFDEPQKLTRFMYMKYRKRHNFQQTLKLVFEQYPEVQRVYENAIKPNQRLK